MILASPSYPRRRSWARWRLPLVVLMLTAAALGAQEPEAAPNEPKPTPSPAPYIAQSEVVAQAEIMSDQIAKISARLEANRVETIAEALAPLVARLEDKAPEVEQRRIDGLRLLPRQQLSQEWETYRQRLVQWEKSLTSISQELERDQAGLKQAVELWDRSLDEARAAEAPAAVIDRMDSLLKRIRVTQERVKQAKALTVLDEASVVLILLLWARLLPAVLRPPLSQALSALAGLFVANRYGNLLMTGEAGLRWLLPLEAGGGALVVLSRVPLITTSRIPRDWVGFRHQAEDSGSHTRSVGDDNPEGGLTKL